MIDQIARTLQLRPSQIEKTILLLNEDATVPFIARYRKEVTGNLDEIQIFEIQKWKKYYEELEKRKQSILKSLEEQGVLTDDLKKRILQTHEATDLEDLYLPYKKKRKTKADLARNAGLEPLAKRIMAQPSGNILDQARKCTSELFPTAEEALEGAGFIIAEWINETPWVRNFMRRSFERTGQIKSRVIKKKAEEEGSRVFMDYFDWKEKLDSCPSHRFLAMKRGEKSGVLRIKLEIDEDFILRRIEKRFIKNNNETAIWIKKAIKDAYKRLLFPSIETEILNKYKEKADKTAINVFSKNLRQLLLSPPLGEKRVLAVDPGFRTGCKIAVIDQRGNYITHSTIFPHSPHNKTEESINTVKNLITKHRIEAVSIGNGTASRETERLFKNMRLEQNLPVFIVNEAGASIYSASEIAREEFPDLDITVRGAISIGRRLQDPLAELVKIEPKSIGVGQYQHDVNQNLLQQELDHVVSSVVNAVGVNLNTANPYLLKYVSGIGEKLAGRIVDYRRINGGFKTREDLKKVKGLGPKAFEQSAGFLRIKNGENPLDDSAVHPESYALVHKMAVYLSVSVKDLIGNEKLIDKIPVNHFVNERYGIHTVTDILNELKKPGLDIREKLNAFSFSEKLHSIDDLKIGEIYPGIINNITNFGCFVDLGIKENGLIHISNMSAQYISDPNEIVKLHQKVRVEVISIDKERKRIGLSLK